MALLVYADTDGVEHRFTVGAEPVTVGRATECAIRSSDPRVSRNHARFFLDPQGTLHVEDLGSSNGVYVGQFKVHISPVPPNELVVVGSITFRLLPPQPVAAPPQEWAQPATQPAAAAYQPPGAPPAAAPWPQAPQQPPAPLAGWQGQGGGWQPPPVDGAVAQQAWGQAPVSDYRSPTYSPGDIHRAPEPPAASPPAMPPPEPPPPPPQSIEPPPPAKMPPSGAHSASAGQIQEAAMFAGLLDTERKARVAAEEERDAYGARMAQVLGELRTVKEQLAAQPAAQAPGVDPGHLAALQGQLATAQGQLSATQGQLATAQGHVAKLKSELAAVQADLATTQAELAKTKDQLARASISVGAQDLEAARDRANDAEDRANAAEARLRSTEEELAVARSDVSAAEERLMTELRTLEERTSAELASRVEELEVTRADLIKAEERIMEMSRKIDELEGTLKGRF